MQGLGMVIVALGMIGLIYGIFQKIKASRVAGAPLVRTGDVARQGTQAAGPNGAVAVEGTVLCTQPVIAPFSGQPCLYYEIKCTAEWKEGETNRSKEVTNQKVAATLAVDDGSGPVPVDLSKGGDFDPEMSKEETKGAGLIGTVTGRAVEFGNFVVPSSEFPVGAKLKTRESRMPVVPRMYVCGKASESGIVAPSFRSLIASSKSRDELLSSATVGAKRFLIGGAIAFAAGSSLAIIGQLTADPSTDSNHTAAPTAK